METTVSTSRILHGLPFQLHRTVTLSSATCTSHTSAAATCSSSRGGWSAAALPAKKLSFRHRNGRMPLPPLLGLRNRCSSSTSAAAGRFAITCGVTEIDESQFSDVVLKSDRPVLVEFVATWCGPCRLMAPAIDWIAQEYKDKLLVVKIDHDSNPRLIEEFKVYGLPNLILFKDGKQVPESRREGAITKVKLKEYLDPFLESVSVS